MEEIVPTRMNYKLDFKGKGVFFGIVDSQFILTIITLRIYLPRKLNSAIYFGQSTLNNDPHGTKKKCLKVSSKQQFLL
jgi:uncharacterized membrane protein YjgN (DUF898 family)